MLYLCRSFADDKTFFKQRQTSSLHTALQTKPSFHLLRPVSTIAFCLKTCLPPQVSNTESVWTVSLTRSQWSVITITLLHPSPDSFPCVGVRCTAFLTLSRINQTSELKHLRQRPSRNFNILLLPLIVRLEFKSAAPNSSAISLST